MANPPVVPASAPGSYGICIAFGQNAYTTTPTWTRIDDPAFAGLAHKSSSPYSGRFATSWSTDRGRAYELDKTQAGTATITVYDTTGYFDPTNPASPFYGQITPMLRAKISVQNPADLYYYDIFTGFLESYDWTMDTAEQIATVTMHLVDGFEPLTRAEIPVDATGVKKLTGGTASPSACQTRITALLAAAGWPDDGLPGDQSLWRNINTGNVFLQDTTYNAQTSYLAAIQDVADAEFPGVANFFVSRRGAATFYGRYPRFQPTNFPQDVNFWQAADRPGLSPSNGAPLISDIQWTLDSKNLINSSLCYPFGIAQTSIYTQLVTDTVSIGQYGVRDLSLPDLINGGQPSSASQPALGANAACQLFGTYYVQNYAQPQLRISKLVFKSRNAGDSQTWQLLTGVEIGDIITVFTTNPGGGGFSKETMGLALSQFFVEGIHNDVKGPLHAGVPDWTLSLDVSPRGWFPANYPIGGNP